MAKCKVINPILRLVYATTSQGEYIKEKWAKKRWTDQKYTDFDGKEKTYGAKTKPTAENLSEAIWESVIEKYKSGILKDVFVEISKSAIDVLMYTDKTSAFYKIELPERSALTIDIGNLETKCSVSIMSIVEMWDNGRQAEATDAIWRKVLMEKRSTAFLCNGTIYVSSPYTEVETKIKKGKGAWVFTMPVGMIGDLKSASVDKNYSEIAIATNDGDIRSEFLREVTRNAMEDLEKSYREGHAIIPDKLFDLLMENLNIKEEEIQKPGVVKSLAKTRSIEEAVDFMRKCGTVAVSPKYDGCAARVVFGDDCEITSAITKGNKRDIKRHMKEIITGELIRQIIVKTGVHKTFNPVRNTIITGEVVSKIGGRELVAGYFARKGDEDIIDGAKDFDFMIYDIEPVGENDDLDFFKNLSYGGRLTKLDYVGLHTVNPERVTKENRLREILDPSSDITKHDDYKHGDIESQYVQKYDTDGIVIRANSYDVYKSCGETQHHPKGAIAFKFHDEYKTVIVKSVEGRVGTNNVLKIIASFDELELGGKTITSAVWQPPMCETYGRYGSRMKRGADINHYTTEVIKVGDKIDVCLRGKVIPLFRPHREN